MKAWLRNWLRRLISSGNGHNGIAMPSPFVSGTAPRTFTLGVTEAQNGWVVNYTRYDHSSGQEHSLVRIVTEETGLAEAVTTMIALHALDK